MQCSKCGNQVLPNQKFCANCGNPIEQLNKSENGKIVQNELTNSQNINEIYESIVSEENSTKFSSQPSLNQNIIEQSQLSNVNQSANAQLQQPNINPNVIGQSQQFNLNQNNSEQPQQPVLNQNGNLETAVTKPKKKKKVLLIIGIILAVLLLLVGSVFVVKNVLGDISKPINVNVNPNSLPHEVVDKKRTIMIYASPTNLESEVKQFSVDILDLNYANIDFDNINVIIYTGGTKKWHNDYVKSGENGIYELTKEGLKQVEKYDITNTNSPETLTGFISYVFENYRTELYDLMIYDHGGSFGGAIADDYNNNGIMSLPNIVKAIDNSPFNEKNKLEMIMFRTCLMSSLEVGLALKPYTDMLIASEDSIYMGGTGVGCFKFMEKITSDTTAKDIAKNFIADYAEYYKPLFDNNQSQIYLSYSILDLTVIDKLEKEFTKFIEELDINKYSYQISKIRNKLYSYGGSDYSCVDLYNLVDSLSPYSTYDAEKVKTAFSDVVKYIVTENETVSKGLSVFFPEKSDIINNTLYSKYYTKLSVQNNYKVFLKNYLLAISGTKIGSITQASISGQSAINNKNKEFTLKLSDEQVKDFQSAQYVLMKKIDDYYAPIYLSKEIGIEDGNVLRSNIVNKIVRIKPTGEDDVENAYIGIFADNVKNQDDTYSSVAIVNNWSYEQQENWRMSSVVVHISDQDGVPTITNFTKNEYDEEKNVKSTINYGVNPEDTISFTINSYKLIDEDGNYTGDMSESNPTVYGYEDKLKNIELEYTSLNDDDGEYYCVFIIKDIYGNKMPSEVMKLS